MGKVKVGPQMGSKSIFEKPHLERFATNFLKSQEGISYGQKGGVNLTFNEFLHKTFHL